MKCRYGHILLGVVLVALLPLVASCGASKQTSQIRPESTHTSVTPSTNKEGDRTKSEDLPEAANGALARAIVAEARTWLGVPYVYGGADRKGADCSGFLMTIFGEVAGIKLPRTTSQQREHCQPITKDELAVGDILFFSSRKSSKKVAHVAIYVGGGRMIHASSSRGVVEDDINLKYYVERYLGSGRVPAIAKARAIKQQSAKASTDSKTKSAEQPITATSPTPSVTTTATPTAAADSTTTTERINSRVRNAFNKAKK